MSFLVRQTCWEPLLLLCVGLGACHSGRVAPAVSSIQPPSTALARKSNVVIIGHVYGTADSTSVVAGAELVFSRTITDSAAQRWRDLTTANGSYRVSVPAGFTYLVELNKDGANIETQEFPVPKESADTVSVVKNFYLNHREVVFYDYWLNNVYFDTKHAELRPESKEKINNIIQILNNNPEIGCVVEGHAEPQEVPAGQSNPEQYLQRLGQRRAQAASAYLVKMGISENRLNPVSYGARRPAAPNDLPENRQLNRRVEFKSVRLEYIPAKIGGTGANTSQKASGVSLKKPVSSNQKLKNAHNRPVPMKSSVRPVKAKGR